MLFVRTDDLKAGMRLARPIYNKNGVLLYGVDTKLTTQGVLSVKNFGLIGIYILEPAEPVPPMTPEDVEFERFQTMAVFTLRDIFNVIGQKKRATTLPGLVNDIMRSYGRMDHKVNFMQNLRSKEDGIYKHSLNVAILLALMSNRMHMNNQEQIKLIMSGLLHESEYNSYELDEGVQKIIAQMYHKLGMMEEGKTPVQVSRMADMLLVAYTYDNMTAMKLDEDPSSEIEAIRYLLDEDNEFSQDAVWSLIDSINILTPGVCIELTNGEKGLVLRENRNNILRPTILSFAGNQILDLYYDSVFNQIQIKDIMKTMDNRVVLDRSLLQVVKDKGVMA